MTKKEYIAMFPKSYLAHSLASVDWDDDCEIRIGSGLIAPHTKSSNLHKALRSSSGEYVVGGHLKEGTQGFYFAVRK